MFKPYSKYKQIGIPWLSETPSHWKTLRNKNVLVECKETVGESSADYTLLSLTLKGIIKRDIESGKGKFPKEFDTYKKISDGNIIFCLFDIDETPRTVGLSSHNGMITGAYDVFNITNINSRYLYLYYLAIDNAKEMKPLYTGLRKVIGVPKFLGIKLPIPPQDEQDQIVRYLDWQLAKINKLIKAKKKQIALLNEQKQLIINQVVTKGLEPNVEMKKTDILFAGSIPHDWEVTRLSRVAQIILSGLDKKIYENQRKVKLCNYVDVYKNNFIDNSLDFMNATASESEYHNLLLNAGDVIITKDSESWDDIAVPAFVKEDMENVCCGYHLAILRSKIKNLKPQILYYAFMSQYVQVQHKIKAKGVTRFALGYQPIHDTVLVLPPVEQQQMIIEYIERSTETMDKSINIIKRELELLSEYRTTIISDVVTGKVDVRKIEVPNEQFEAEEIDETDDIVAYDIEGDVLEDE